MNVNKHKLRNGNGGHSAVVESLPVLTEIDKLRLQSLSARLRLARAELDNLVLQFIHTNDTAKQANSQIVALQTEQDQLVALYFQAHGMQMLTHSINVDTGEFVLKVK